MNKSAKTFVDHDKTSKALKKAKEEIARLAKKAKESLKSITKLRETMFPEVEYNKIMHQKYRLETLLEKAECNDCRG